MSRSRRYTAIRGVCGGSHCSEKLFKRMSHRRERAAMRTHAARAAVDEHFAERAEHYWVRTDIWDGDKDGKMWIDPEQDNGKWMRK